MLQNNVKRTANRWQTLTRLASDGPTIRDCATDRNNNFNLIRIIAASAVLFSHSYPIALGPDAAQPLTKQFGFTLGYAAVAWFFILSGFLISQSFERRASVSEFSLARALRLFPGLACVLLLTVFALGPLATSQPLHIYFSAQETYTYLIKNLTLARLQYTLPGVFDSNPYGPAINGSLWTLIHEVMCYAILALVGLAGLFTSRRTALAVLTCYVLIYIFAEIVPTALPPKLMQLKLLSFPFALGMIAYCLRSVLRLNLFWLLVAGSAIVVAGQIPFSFELFAVGSTYVIFYVGYRIKGALLSYNRLGDYSYGIYIYAFPIQQAAMNLFSTMTPASNSLTAFPITLLFAVASWHFVEQRALRARSWIMRWMRPATG